MTNATMQTNHGAIEIELFDDDAPKTVANFTKLARDGFYDGVIFHRVIQDFMIQGGDPTGTGSGGPGYQFEDEINPHKVERGALAMANAGPNTNGSQFFIVTASACPWLDGLHTVFGKVASGMDVVDTINGTDTDMQDRPVDEVKIVSISVAPAVTMKNWEPFVFGPALAMASAPRTTFWVVNSSSNWYPGPPDPVPVGSPPWIMKSGITR